MKHWLAVSAVLLVASPSRANMTSAVTEDAAAVERVGRPLQEQLRDQMAAWRPILFVENSPADAVWMKFGARYAALEARVAAQVHPGDIARSRFEFQALLEDALHERHKAAKNARLTDAGYGDYKSQMTALAERGIGNARALRAASSRMAAAADASAVATPAPDATVAVLPVLPSKTLDGALASMPGLLPSRSFVMSEYRLAVPGRIPLLVPYREPSLDVQLFLADAEAAVAERYGEARRFLLQRGAQAQVVDATISQALKKGVDPIVPLAVCMQESGCAATTVDKRGRVVPVKSGAGAIGAFQIMPDIHGASEIELQNSSLNVSKGIGLLVYLHKKFDDFSLTLAGYNAGEGAVQKAGGVPDYAETKDFVAKVAANVETLRRHVAESLPNKP